MKIAATNWATIVVSICLLSSSSLAIEWQATVGQGTTANNDYTSKHVRTFYHLELADHPYMSDGRRYWTSVEFSDRVTKDYQYDGWKSERGSFLEGGIDFIRKFPTVSLGAGLGITAGTQRFFREIVLTESVGWHERVLSKDFMYGPNARFGIGWFMKSLNGSGIELTTQMRYLTSINTTDFDFRIGVPSPGGGAIIDTVYSQNVSAPRISFKLELSANIVFDPIVLIIGCGMENWVRREASEKDWPRWPKRENMLFFGVRF